MKYSLHNHTYRCKHAVGSEEEMLVQGIKDGYQVFGISDHMAYPIDNCYARMEYHEKDDYLAQLDLLKAKYHNQITFYRGFEAEYEVPFDNYLIKLIKEDKIDYFVLGQHYLEIEDSSTYIGRYTNSDYVEAYVDRCIEAMATNLFLFIAHPDVFALSIDEFDDVMIKQSRRLIEASIKYDVPLEYNAGGIRKALSQGLSQLNYDYPAYEFWQLVKEYNASVVINSDAHAPLQISDDAYQLACIEGYELGLNILEDIDIKKYQERLKITLSI